MLNVHKIHPGDSNKIFFWCFPEHKQGFFRVVSECVFLIKVLNLWLLTLISLVDIKAYFNLRSLSLFIFSPSNQDIHYYCIWVKKANVSQEKMQVGLLCPRQGGREHRKQNKLNTTANTWMQPFAPVFTASHPGLLKLDLRISLWEHEHSELPKLPLLWLAPLGTAVGRWVWKEKGTFFQSSGLWLLSFLCECHQHFMAGHMWGTLWCSPGKRESMAENGDICLSHKCRTEMYMDPFDLGSQNRMHLAWPHIYTLPYKCARKIVFFNGAVVSFPGLPVGFPLPALTKCQQDLYLVEFNSEPGSGKIVAQIEYHPLYICKFAQFCSNDFSAS